MLPPQILAIAGTFPFSLVTHPFAQRPAKLLEMLYRYLPLPEVAVELREYYFRYAVFMCVPSARFGLRGCSRFRSQVPPDPQGRVRRGDSSDVLLVQAA